MATILELAKFSDLVYGDKTAAADISALNIGTGAGFTWSLLDTSSNPKTGYYGAAYINNITGEIVIANRGTNPLNPADLLTDIKLATGQQSPAQNDAVAFAKDVAALAKKTNPNPAIIETGHSLGGSEAQAATAVLTDLGISSSAVTFNAPGIATNYVPLHLATSYNVLNLYDQGDAIHLAGGAHLGLSAMLQAGPNTSSLALGIPLAVAAGPVGIVALLATALWDVLGPAHSINTIIDYFQKTLTVLGALTWTSAANALPLIPTVPSNPADPQITVNPDGSLKLTDANGNYATFLTGPKQTITATFTAGGGGASAIFQELAALGTVSIPVAELNQVVTGLSSATNINETVTRNANNTFGVSFNSSLVNPNSGNQFSVTTVNNGAAFDYVVPTNGQTLVETIDNGANNNLGSVSVITSSGISQLKGGTLVTGKNNTWTDTNGDQYVFDPSTGTLTITQGLLGTGNGNQIIIQNFDLNAAQTSAGYLGIKFRNQIAAAAGANFADDPFTNGGIYTAQTHAANVPNGNVQTVTLYASAASATAQTVTLTGGSASSFISTGADLIAFNGSVTLIIPAGQDHVTFGLIDTSNTKQPDTLNLSASLTTVDGTTTSNPLTVTFNDPNPNAGAVPPAGTPDRIIIGDLMPVNFGTAASPQYHTDDLGNLVTDPSLPSPNRNDSLNGSVGSDLINAGGGDNYIYATQGGNDTITSGAGNDTIQAGNGNNSINSGDGTNSIQAGSGNNTVTGGVGNDLIGVGNGQNVINGNGGQDIVMAGSGNNQIYAKQQTDLATAFAQAKRATASGLKGSFLAVGNGNNTLVGGTGNDVFVLGGGNDLVICGPGNDTIMGGEIATSVQAGWTTKNSVQVTNINTNFIVTFQGAALNSSGGYTGTSNSSNDVNMDSSGIPAGGGSETIFGGSGNNFISGSNGNGNYIDVGSGNSTVFSGAGNDTIFAGTGNSTISGQDGNDYIVGETGNDWLLGGAGNNTIFGGSGNDTISADGEALNWADSNRGNNYVDGGSGNSVIFGTGGNDTLIGGTGNASIYGGNGNQYIVGGSGNVSINGGNGHDTIYAGGNGRDTIFAGDGHTTIYGGGGTDSLVGGAGVDIILAGDGGTIAAPTLLYAGSGTSSLYGGAGVDELFGGSGSDTLVAGTGTNTLQGGTGTEVMYASIGNATLIAGTGADTLYGGGGSDVLQGTSGNTLFVAGSGNETIFGGSGSNTYQFNAGFGNVALGNTTAADTFQFGPGISLADLTLTAALDSSGAPAFLIQASSGGTLTIYGGLDGAINQFAFANGPTLTLNQMMALGHTTPTTTAGATGDLIFSASGSDTLVGGAGNDTIYGWNGHNTLIAGSGNQTLNSKSGNDTLIGGTGNDTFIINSATDLIQAKSTGSNINTVLSSVSYVAPTNVQHLTLTGTAALTATGNTLSNLITANSGNDTLIAGAGLATMVGGKGNDTFVVNNTADVIQAQSTGTNTNTVLSSVSYVAPANVQNITFTGAANLTATGNNLHNVIIANSGNDTLMAGVGLATLVGGTGNDTFVVNNVNDVVQAQFTGLNTNTVLSSVSYVAPANVQNITLTGTASITATGNNLHNVITANSGNDTLTGGSGSGTLVGGTGLDTFVLGAATGSYTAIKQSSAKAIVQIAQGLGVSDVTAKQSGNDLVLSVGAGSGLRLKNYYLDPLAWTIKDTHSNTTTAQALLDATTQAQSNLLSFMETQYLNKVKAGYVQQLISSGYVLQPDGSWYIRPTSSSIGAWYQIQNDNYTYIYINPTTGAISSSTTSQQYKTWSSNGIYIHDSSASIQQTTINATAKVIFTSFNSYSATTYNSVWLQVNWAPLGSPAYTSHYNYSFPSNGSGGALASHQSGTVTDYLVSGTTSGSLSGSIQSSTGGLTTQGPFPQLVSATFGHLLTTDLIQQINVGVGDHTVYVWDSQALVNSSSGNDTIYGAGFAYGGTGNDTMIDGGTLVAGSGNDLLIDGAVMIAGTGNDQMFANQVASTFIVNGNNNGVDLIGGKSYYTSAVVDAFYRAQGVSNWYESYSHPDQYFYITSTGKFSKTTYVDPQFASAVAAGWGLTLPQALSSGRMNYISPLPVLVIVAGISPPATYYATSNTPQVIFAANDFQTLLPYYAQGIIPTKHVELGAGIARANLQFSWGVVIGSISGESYDPQLRYTTLNITSGPTNPTLEIMIPHSDDPLGSGVTEFDFADGTKLNIAQLIAMAPPAPTFDPQIFVYQSGMGVKVLGVGYSSIRFGASITSSMITLGVGPLGELMLRVGTSGDVINITQFDPSNALAPNSIQTFNFADGSSLNYAQLLTRGFDIYGTTGNETLTGTNLDNRIYAGTGNDTLIGSGANDTLIAGAGLDTLIGGTGNETFVVNNVNDVVQAQSTGRNTNTVLSSVNYVAPANVQNITLTGTANLTATGNTLNNVITGNSGNDTLIAGAGLATMVGGTGNDTFVVNNVNDVIQAKSTGSNINTVLSSVNYVAPVNVQNITLTGLANLTATGNTLNNVITGNAGNDTLIAGSGNDTLIAGSGLATMVGGIGNETFVVNNVNDVIQAKSSGTNTNTVLSSVNYVAPANVQNITLTGTANLKATGNTLNNVITGNSGNDTLIAGSGSDTLIAGSGNATLVGGTGVDTFVFNHGGVYTLIDPLKTIGDVIQFGPGITSGMITLGLGSLMLRVGNSGEVIHIMNFDPSNALAPNAIQKFSFADGTSLSYAQLLARGFDIYGTTGNETLSGTNLDNRIYAGTGNDTLIGTGANDTLVAGAGIDTMIGGTGNETFVVNNVNDVILAKSTGSNTNTVLSSVNYIAPANVQNITLTGTANLTATGNNLNNVITGNAGNDTLIAGSGNATLIAGTGLATMVGGIGNDTFVVNNIHDVIQAKSTGSNINTVLSSVNYVAPSNVQNITLTGTANLTATGNNLNNVITGNAGNDTLIAGSGNATLIAGTGLATMVGGTGNDTFVVNNIHDVIQAKSTGTNVNTVLSSVSYVAPANVQNITLTGTANLTATGNNLKNVITANSGNDTLIAGTGIATLVGGTGNDTFVVNNIHDVIQAKSTGSNINTVLSSVNYVAPANVQNITLTGTANLTATGNNLNNIITGNSGRDWLIAGNGNDTLIAGTGITRMLGGAGNDTFVVNNIHDVIHAKSTGTNINTVLSSVNYVTPVNVQNITLTGTANLTATGNNLKNVITANSGNDTLIAGIGLATMVGGTGNDTFVVNNIHDVIQAKSTGSNINTVLSSVSYVTPANVQNLTGTGTRNITLTGNSLKNVITANIGNDTLIAGTGLATLVGGTGNDTFVVNNAGDVIQAQSTGTNVNTVLSSVSYVAPTNVQNITLTGITDLTATGNSLNNVITANSGNDTLIAGAGIATLVGGTGNDTFVVNNIHDVIHAKSTGSNINTVLSSVNYVAPANVQNITLTGTANLRATGNSLNDVITGNMGKDTLVGGSGIDILIAGSGQSVLSDTRGRGILLGGIGNDTLIDGTANDFIAGGLGNDVITTKSSNSVVAFNIGDGQDTITGGKNEANTLSLGGTINLNNLTLNKQGNDLILSTASLDSITFKGWYASAANHDFATLQMVGPLSPSFGNKVNEFKFSKLVTDFDQARAINPTLSNWHVMNSLLSAHLSGSDTAALGGDLAYYYGSQGTLTGMSLVAAQSTLQSPQFGVATQAVHPWASINQGVTLNTGTGH